MIKNFNIQEAAGGSGKPIIKKFTVNVTDHNLKIGLRWAGKGTTGIPVRGVYGPMISAISVEPSKFFFSGYSTFLKLWIMEKSHC